MKNFDFIKELAEVIPAFNQLHAYCDKAEIFQKAFPEESAANARKALEWLVKNHLAMANVTLDTHETLSQMIKRPEIDAFINEDWELDQNMRTVKKIGNFAAHIGSQQIRRNDATSMPKTTGQEPLYYNHQNTGRPVPDDNQKFAKYASNCLDVSNGPLYPFGYGLSYTTFEYSNFKLNSQEADINGNQEATEWQNGKKITATITVKNTGNRDADEIVQLYIRDMVASISRPIKELKGFKRIHLAAGESKEVSFEITPDMLKFYNIELKHVIEPGDFQIMIGANSKEVETLNFNVK